MERQSLFDWSHRFSADGPGALLDAWTNGPTPRLSLEQRSELSALVNACPDRQADSVVSWRRIDLKLIINKRFGVDFCEQHVGTLLKTLGLSLVCTTPAVCRSNCSLQSNFPQTLGTHLSDFPEQTPVETWLQDEARIGQKMSFSANGADGDQGHANRPISAMRKLSLWRHMADEGNRRGDCRAIWRH